MPLLKNGQIQDDTWVVVSEQDTLPSGDILVLLSQLDAGIAQKNGREGRLGVVLASGDEVESLRNFVSQLDAVEVVFPVFRDGRGFTQARALREHLRFAGDIRASGHILPDQYEFLLRCGVTDVVLPEGADVAAWERAHKAFTVAYQPSVQNERAEGFALRRRLF